MKRLYLLLSAVVVSTAFVAKTKQQELFSSLLVLEGTWQTNSKNGKVIGEQWIKINDSLLQGKGFFVNGKDTVITEKVTLKHAAGTIIYISTVSGQNEKKPVSFILTTDRKDEFIFENDGHDFPKRIVYKFISPDSIHAFIDAGKSNSNKRQDYYYKKVK